MAQSGLFNWLAHLDSPKKRGLGRAERWVDTECRAVDVIIKPGTRLDFNADGFVLPYNEPYPSSCILNWGGAANIPVLISDDALSVDQVAPHFENAMDFAHKYGVNHFMTLDTILRLIKNPQNGIG